VYCSIDFHYQSCFRTVKVDDVSVYLMLPSKFETTWFSGAQFRPKQFFRRRLLSAPFSSVLKKWIWCFHGSKSLTPYGEDYSTIINRPLSIFDGEGDGG